MKYLPIITLLFFLVSCAPNATDYQTQQVLDNRCKEDLDCTVPLDYAIRKDCIFETRCIERQCIVICPLREYDEKTTYRSAPITCENNSECNCDMYYANDSFNCSCVQNQCAAQIILEPITPD